MGILPDPMVNGDFNMVPQLNNNAKQQVTPTYDTIFSLAHSSSLTSF